MNSSFNITDPDDTDGNTAPYFPAYGHALLGCMLAFVFVFGSISNGLGILTFMKNKHLRSPTNTFILSLLISDFGMCFIGTPLTMMASFATKWIWGDVGCSMEGFLVFLFGMTNMYSLVAISVDRFVVIALPLHSSKITDRVAFMCCLGCWSIGLFWSTAPFFGWSYYHLEAVHTSCAVVWESDDPVITSYTMALFAFGFFFPVSLMLFSYCNVYLTIRNVARNNVWDMSSRIARKNLAVEKKMFKTILIMVSVFFTAWTPYAVVSFWAAIAGSGQIPLVAQAIPAITAKCSSAFDPMIYVATNKQFRTAFYNLLPCAGLRKSLQNREEQKEERSEDGDKTTSKTKQKKPDSVKKINAVHPADEDEADTQIEAVSPSARSHREEAMELKDVSKNDEES